ncbi:MAG TPA: response regulator [Candidatus Eisenbacteria bacterium]|nr:response regulator [Candidatus Eisenbacteria bacterium]
MNMPDLRETFLAQMGFALLEYRGDGAFLPIAKLPTWFLELWSQKESATIPLALSEQSPFLENFLLEAEAYWESPNAAGCRSETWIEKTPSGREIPLQARALLLDGKRVVALFSPETDLRERTKVLQTARNALLDHERLGREIQKKEILLHCIVHDLSQPLSVMHVALDCLADESITERSRQFLTLGKLAGEQQETMIRDILHTFSADLRASLDAGTEENASTDLLDCARKTMAALGPTFVAKGVHLSFTPSADETIAWPVRAEPSRLQRIFSNLLENALRYTPSGARVAVGFEDEGAFLKAYIDDEGPGLPNDLRPEQIFGLFLKGKHSGGKAGLGLYFCRITVERWGGSIGCVTLPVKGSRFWFRLARAIADSDSAIPAAKHIAANSPAGSSAQRVPPLHILFADDQKDIRTLTTYQLKRKGHKVAAAANGKQAMRLFRSRKFELVLLDQEMPGMTGDEVARAIRKSEAGKKSRAFLVASTGNTGAEDVRRLKAAGFDTVLGKPFRMDDLLGILQTAAKQHSSPPGLTQSQTPAELSYAALLERVGGDPALLKRMIATFLRDTPKRLSAISTALRRKSAGTLASLAHALKGSVSIFGAEQARLHAQELQELARTGDLASAQPLLAPLKEEIANLLGNLRGYANQTAARPARKRPRHPRNRGKHRR